MCVPPLVLTLLELPGGIRDVVAAFFLDMSNGVWCENEDRYGIC
jgi:hypothetical protein